MSQDMETAAAEAILAEAARQAVRRAETETEPEEAARIVRENSIRHEAKTVARAVLQSKTGVSQESLPWPYRSAIANVAARYFWQSGIRPGIVLQNLDEVPLRREDATSPEPSAPGFP
ncbi:hypothetical protein [Amycolatopsis sp. NPDC058986]|uniref:hypothetical protein n=1 Tax=unclassified Amycolatopsis TaxID=2618356 RepID=UPI003670D94C